MMFIQYSPQYSDNRIINYVFEGEKIIAELIIGEDTEADEFDFSSLPDGKITRDDETGETSIETTLSINPVIDAERVNGVLTVTLLKYHSHDAPYEERFPELFEVKFDE